jgi:hypothetical protein
MGARTHGRGTRSNPQKSIRLYAKEEYGKDRIEYPFFGDTPVSSFKRLILRSPDADFTQTLFKDELIHRLLRGMNLDLQAAQPSVVFINGEYWGIHNLRERQDRYYLSSHYGVPSDGVDILGYDKGDEEVIEGDNRNYQEMVDYIQNHDMAVPEHYAYIQRQIDTDNFIDYQIAQIFLANFDWPTNNVRYWRPRQPGGRWRWLFFDCDACMTRFSLPELTRYLPATAEGDPARFLLSRLLRNAEFRNQFTSRFYVHLNTTFEPGRIIRMIEQFRAEYAPMVAEHIARWNSPPSLAMWLEALESLKRFALLRPPEMLRQLKDVLPAPLLLYPNPASDRLYLDALPDAPVTLTFLDTRGRQVAVRQISAGSDYTDISQLPSGLYLVRMQYGQLTLTQKLSVIR